MSRWFIDPDQVLLDSRFPLPLDRPFTSSQARAEGLRDIDLHRLAQDGFLRRLFASVYVATQAPDSLVLRAAALRLVVPPGAVVTDRTAGWLHGASMILAPNDHLVVPKLSVFHRGRGCRLRNDPTRSGQRMMPDTDVVEIMGLAVTTPVRTTCDLGRLLRREPGFAAMDSMLRLGVFEHEELLENVPRFKGDRGVRQLRVLAPLADGRAESPGESVLRLRWYDCPGLPRPELQIPVQGPGDTFYWLDLGLEELGFAAEYDGAEFHGEDQAEHDRVRRNWITDNLDWRLEVAVARNVFGRHQDIDQILTGAITRARASRGVRRVQVLDLASRERAEQQRALRVANPGRLSGVRL